MTRRRLPGCPDAHAVLDQLKGFQRAAVEVAFDRLYSPSDSSKRFLIADEVGLGKTLIARGIVAQGDRAPVGQGGSDRRGLHLLQPLHRPPEHSPSQLRRAHADRPADDAASEYGDARRHDQESAPAQLFRVHARHFFRARLAPRNEARTTAALPHDARCVAGAGNGSRQPAAEAGTHTGTMACFSWEFWGSSRDLNGPPEGIRTQVEGRRRSRASTRRRGNSRSLAGYVQRISPLSRPNSCSAQGAAGQACLGTSPAARAELRGGARARPCNPR